MIASMIFFPVREFSYQPVDFGLKAEEVYCDTADGARLHGWYFPPEAGPPSVRRADKATSEKTVLLFFHGNADNISIRLPKASEWLRRGISVFLIDYRGYGKSSGKIKKGGDLISDAHAAYRWLKEKKAYPASQIILYGESIGSFPAIWLATEERVKALILEAPFTSLKELAKLHYGWASDFFLKDFEFENEALISSVQCPVFILHGAADEIAPVSMAERLFRQAPEPKELFKIPDAHHNDVMEMGGKDFFDRPFRFVASFER